MPSQTAYLWINGVSRGLVSCPGFSTVGGWLQVANMGQGSAQWGDFAVTDWQVIPGAQYATYFAAVGTSTTAPSGNAYVATGLNVLSVGNWLLDNETFHAPNSAFNGRNGWNSSLSAINNANAEASFIQNLTAHAGKCPDAKFCNHYVPPGVFVVNIPSSMAAVEAIDIESTSEITANDALLAAQIALSGFLACWSYAIVTVAADGYEKCLRYHRYVARRSKQLRKAYGNPGQQIVLYMWWKAVGSPFPYLTQLDVQAFYEACRLEGVDGAILAKADNPAEAAVVQNLVDTAWEPGRQAGLNVEMAGPSIPSYLFDANWRESPSMSSEFETQIDLNKDGTEQRRGLRGKPRRTLRHAGLTLSNVDAGKLLLQMREQSDTLVYHPIVQDESPLTSQASAGAGSLACETSDRRFFAGHDILLVAWNKTKTKAKIERHTITSVSAGLLDIDGVLGQTFSKGSSVYPCIVAQPNLQQTGEVVNDSVFQFNLSLAEETSASTLPPLVAPGTNPAGASTYKGLPILDIPHHWQTTSEGVTRQGRTSEIGLGTIFSIYGDAADYTGQLSFRQTDRTKAFDVLRFFDSRGGSAFPFWYPMRARALIATAKTSITLTVTDNVPLTQLTGDNKLLALWLKDGSVLIRFVVGGSSGVGTHVITLNETVSATLAEIEKISFACVARFATDAINEQWLNTQVMETGLSIKGVPFSGDLACEGQCCEAGNCACDPEGCDDPEPPPPVEPPDDPWEPGDICENGTADVPMYYDILETWNSGREPIRAADINLPDSIVLTVKNTMVVDPLHPEAPADLSDELKAVLFQPHELVYAGTITRTSEKSRNPYHYRVQGTSTPAYGRRAGGENVSNSPYWQVIYNYKINEGTPEEESHNLFIRMYAEYVDQGSGSGDTGFGMWGTAYVIWAWSTEHNDYVDGTAYAPFSGVDFSKTDPFVGGLYESLSAEVKYCHPSALFMAMCPTTWHTPIGYAYHSMLDRNQFLHECNALLPGAPWSDGGAADAIDNAVFGAAGTRRAIGSLGGWTESEFFNWVCIENGDGSGKTILKPTRPGWDEASATLTPGSADITIYVCTPNQSANAINPCEGHPDNPCQSIGGTHECWRDNSPVGTATSWIGLGIAVKTDVKVVEPCITLTSHYDASCNVTSFACHYAWLETTFKNLMVEDYGFAFGVDPDTRFIDYVQYEDNPDYIRKNWPQIQCDTAGTYWLNSVGSGSVSLTGCPSAPDGDIVCTPTTGKTVNLLVSFDDPSSTDEPEDGSLSYTVTPTGTSKVGVAFRSDVASGSISEGYLGILDMVSDKLILYVVTGTDTLSVMAETSIPDGIPVASYRLGLTAKGHTLTFVVEGLGSVTAIDCEHPAGNRPGIAALSTAAFTAQDVSLIDDNWKKVSIVGSVEGEAIITSAADLHVCKGYLSGACDGCIPEDCPGDDPGGAECNGPCSSICKHIEGNYNVASTSYPASSAEPHSFPGGWNPPNENGNCDSPSCNPPATPCGDCPPPYRGYTWNFNGDYSNSTNPATNLSIWRTGLSDWSWTVVSCP